MLNLKIKQDKTEVKGGVNRDEQFVIGHGVIYDRDPIQNQLEQIR